MKYIKTEINEQETIVNFLYDEQIIKVYSSRVEIIKILTKAIGEPTIKYKKSKSYWSGASWDISFNDNKKIEKILILKSFVDSDIKIKKDEKKNKQVKKENTKKKNDGKSKKAVKEDKNAKTKVKKVEKSDKIKTKKVEKKDKISTKKIEKIKKEVKTKPKISEKSKVKKAEEKVVKRQPKKVKEKPVKKVSKKKEVKELEFSQLSLI